MTRDSARSSEIERCQLRKVADIVAFLESLTGAFPQQTMPRLPPTPGNLLQ